MSNFTDLMSSYDDELSVDRDKQLIRRHRYHGKFMAAELLKLSSDVRKDYQGIMLLNYGKTLTSNFFRNIIPELAVRLGCPRKALDVSEGNNDKIAQLDNRELRNLINVCLKRLSLSNFINYGKSNFPNDSTKTEQEISTGLTLPVVLMLNAPGNGNVVAFGIEQVVGASKEYEDYIVEDIRNTALNRGHGHVDKWNPTLLVDISDKSEHDVTGDAVQFSEFKNGISHSRLCS